ncbi:hypothetical protein B0H67DRAFT_90114 [Lasiosphaeris hirsuta]|uniref:Uncharacterized protein n=1 Tax=Lasiosphaeris hirsuta TaxID=260670 RepID=A0AA40BCV4_9PEZI|nr:hypothetical protein B0H67DRAFT_90114 [Lasiosphaeris hirsuta]
MLTYQARACARYCFAWSTYRTPINSSNILERRSQKKRRALSPRWRSSTLPATKPLLEARRDQPVNGALSDMAVQPKHRRKSDGSPPCKQQGPEIQVVWALGTAAAGKG